MTASADFIAARRYLLGSASEDDCAVLELEYLWDEASLERMAAAEDDLIEEYLSGRLTRADRDRFERFYLASSKHQVRVDTIRRLIAQAAPVPWVRPAAMPVRPRAHVSASRWLPLAASLILAASSAALWVLAPSAGSLPAAFATPAVARPLPVTPDRNPSRLRIAPRVFAVTLSPVAVRSASTTPDVVVPEGADMVAITFEGPRPASVVRASIRAVGGREIWQGPVAADTILPAGTVARLDLPAASLPPDDYIVTLYSSDPALVARGESQYFLRVRRR